MKMTKTLFCTHVPHSPVTRVSVCRPIAVCCRAHQSYNLPAVSECSKNCFEVRAPSLLATNLIRKLEFVKPEPSRTKRDPDANLLELATPSVWPNY